MYPGGTPGGHGQALHIVEAETPLPEAGTEVSIRRTYHFCFRVLDIEAQMEKLKALGVKFEVCSLPGGSTVRQVLFYDPDGNGIELQDCKEMMPEAEEAAAAA